MSALFRLCHSSRSMDRATAADSLVLPKPWLNESLNGSALLLLVDSCFVQNKATERHPLLSHNAARMILTRQTNRDFTQ
ncbi:MAG: hypothetical protein KDA89_15960 [Planctomycetaceae bacterium]|nr:hypothetical protein [Planctomycetaceae bacterium]